MLFSQKVYHFDYMLEYEYRNTSDSDVETRYILTSSDQDHYMIARKEDENMLAIHFVNPEGVYIMGSVNKDEFLKTENYFAECKDVFAHTNPYKHLVKDYEFIEQPDTLIDGVIHSYYILKYRNPKKEKRKRIARNHYIISPQTEYHDPVFIHPTAYEEWKTEGAVPNGIFRNKYTIDLNGRKSLIYKLKKIHKIDKFLQHPEGCNTENPTLIQMRTIDGVPSGYEIYH